MVSNNKIDRNEFSNNDYGIYLYSSNNNNITNNSISNGEYGLYFYESSNDNVITDNTVSNHDYGVYIDFLWCHNNRFYRNNFINNVNQANDDMFDNVWNNSYPTGGNYWSDFDEPSEGAYDDYHGPNQDIPGSDGIIDNGSVAGGGMNPYVIDPDSQDNYPLRAPPPLPPRLYINIIQGGDDVMLNWDPPSTPGIDHYLIYRSTSQTDFDFNTIWVNTSKDNGTGQAAPIPLRTMFNDTNAASPGNISNYKEQYYYVIRAVNVLGEVSGTSRTVGKWTRTFPQGVSTFSLPLEPLEKMTVDHLLNDMNAGYIKWIQQGSHKWMKHGDGGVNDTQMKLGEGYEVKFDSQINYSFTGMPGAMINYDSDTGFLGFDPATEAKNLTVSVEPNGNVTLTWEEPASMNPGDCYEVYYSNTRDGFFGTFNVSYFLVCPPVYFGNNTTPHNGALANKPGTHLYYMVVPFNASGIRGASTYSIGIWTEEYIQGYDTFGIPLKLVTNQTADWYCDNIPDAVGINYYIYSQQRWAWHSTRMPAEAYDPILEMTEGYQISTSNTTKFTFIGR
jgi:parallel beta-helix repeat protein